MVFIFLNSVKFKKTQYLIELKGVKIIVHKIFVALLTNEFFVCVSGAQNLHTYVYIICSAYFNNCNYANNFWHYYWFSFILKSHNLLFSYLSPVIILVLIVYDEMVKLHISRYANSWKWCQGAVPNGVFNTHFKYKSIIVYETHRRPFFVVERRRRWRRPLRVAIFCFTGFWDSFCHQLCLKNLSRLITWLVLDIFWPGGVLKSSYESRYWVWRDGAQGSFMNVHLLTLTDKRHFLSLYTLKMFFFQFILKFQLFSIVFLFVHATVTYSLQGKQKIWIIVDEKCQTKGVYCFILWILKFPLLIYMNS